MKPTKRGFRIGHLIATKSVDELFNSCDEFRSFVIKSFERYTNCDWGDLRDSDWSANDNAVVNGERILASYTYKNTNLKIWIITEWDRSATTILFPEDY